MLGRPWLHVEWVPTPRDHVVTCGLCQHEEESEPVGDSIPRAQDAMLKLHLVSLVTVSPRTRDAVTSHADASRRHLHSRRSCGRPLNSAFPLQSVGALVGLQVPRVLVAGKWPRTAVQSGTDRGREFRRFLLFLAKS